MNKNKVFLKDMTYSLSSELSYLFYKIKSYFLKNNYTIVDSVDYADYILVCTYWYLSEVEKLTYDYILSLKEKISDKKLYIFWDLWSWKNSLKNIPFITDFVPTYDLTKLDRLFGWKYSINDILSSEIEQDSIFHGDKWVDPNHKYYFLEISAGCIHSCNFCQIKKNIWYVKSRSISQLVKELEYAVKSGYNLIVLLWEDAWSYGLDIWTNFWELLDAFCNVKWDYQINIHYLHPAMALKYKDYIIRYIDKIYKFNMPIQSFSERILKKMNRFYKVDNVINFIKDLKKIKPEIIIDNHIIYAFPGETFEEFLNNIKLSVKYYYRTVFIEYRYIEWTKKFSCDDLLNEDEIKKRKYVLLRMMKKYLEKNWDKWVNKINVLAGEETYKLVLEV